jgi:hypothetical protein
MVENLMRGRHHHIGTVGGSGVAVVTATESQRRVLTYVIPEAAHPAGNCNLSGSYCWSSSR